MGGRGALRRCRHCSVILIASLCVLFSPVSTWSLQSVISCNEQDVLCSLSRWNTNASIRSASESRAALAPITTSSGCCLHRDVWRDWQAALRKLERNIHRARTTRRLRARWNSAGPNDNNAVIQWRPTSAEHMWLPLASLQHTASLHPALLPAGYYAIAGSHKMW